MTNGRLALSGSAVLFVMLSILVYAVALRGSSSAEDAHLKGVTTSDLGSAGIHVTVADGEALATADKAKSIVLGDYPEAKILETVLVNMTNGGEFKDPRLTWVVNIDPSSITVPAHCPHGAVCPSPVLGFAAYFIDAKSGEMLFFQTIGSRGPILPVASDAPVKP